MYNVQFETQVADLGTILYCDDSPFDSASEALLKKSDELISLRDLAYARVKEGKNSSVSENNSYVREGSLFVPNSKNKRILLRESLVLQNPYLATSFHRSDKEYDLYNFNVDEYLEKIGANNYLILKDTTPVLADKFDKDERTLWMFKDQAKEYGLLLKDAGIESVNMWFYPGSDRYIDAQLRPFANQLLLRRLGSNASIDGDEKHLNLNRRVCGVRFESKDLYTSKEVIEALDNIGIPIIGDVEKNLLTELYNLKR